jgi:hypothetical protein
MSDGITRSAVPKDEVTLFVTMVLSLAHLCKIDKIPEVQHHVDLLVKAVDTHLFEKEHGSNSSKPMDEKKRFIIIFKNRHRVSLDYEYPSKTISPIEARMIGQFIANKLVPKHLDSDFYLAWFFDTFLVRKPQFNPPTLKLACSNMCWTEFVYDTRDELKEKKEAAEQQEETSDLINRARESIRRTQDTVLKTKITATLKKFMDKGIMFLEFRRNILELEKASRQ